MGVTRVNRGMTAHGGQGGDLTEGAPSDLVLIRQAARQGWPVDDALRRKCLDTADGILDNGTTQQKLLAVRAIILADSLNVRREATASAEASALLSASTSALRAALANPALRQALTAIDPSPPAPEHTTTPDTTSTDNHT